MNPAPRPPTPFNPTATYTKFQQLLQQKSHNFIGRQFVFTAITEFLQKCDRGYFTLVGVPGSGKSAILAKLVTEHPQVLYYNTQGEGNNQAEHFLWFLSTQLIQRIGSEKAPLLTSLRENHLFIPLLQHLSDSLPTYQQFLIVIDGLDAIDRSSQSADANLFYLPRYLPKGVYFLLSRRPFVPEKSGLLIEAPSQVFDLEQYPTQNQEDARLYIQQFLHQSSIGYQPSEASQSATSPLREEHPEIENLASWLRTHHVSNQEWSERLLDQSQNNFMYLSQILTAMSQGFYPEPLQFQQLPPALEEYYHSHWQRMRGNRMSTVKEAVLNTLVQQEQPLSVEAIATRIAEDEYEVETVLDSWFEFLHQQQLGSEVCYEFYHPSFRHFLKYRNRISRSA